MRMLLLITALPLCWGASPAAATPRGKKAAAAQAKHAGNRASKGHRIDRYPAVNLVHIKTKERFAFRLYDKRGRANRPVLRRLRHFMRCRRTGRSRPIAWRLARTLYSVGRKYAGRTVYVYSGVRHRRVARLRGSRHIVGHAVDIHVAGVSNRALRDYLRRSYRAIGVGYYPNSYFVHLDVRDRSAFWVDLSGPGRPSRYVSALAYLTSERAHRRSPAGEVKLQPVGPAPTQTVALSKVVAPPPIAVTPQHESAAATTTVVPAPDLAEPVVAAPQLTKAPLVPPSPLGTVDRVRPAGGGWHPPAAQ